MGRVVVQVPGVVEAGTLLRVLGAAAAAASSEESSDRSAAELNWPSKCLQVKKEVKEEGRFHRSYT